MGTKFRTLLAPIGMSTGDGRRFADGSMTLAETPFPFEWVRVREGGHDGAVGVGAIQEAKILTVADAIKGEWISEAGAKGLDPAMKGIFGKGELFDDVNREELPRLAEDVAESMHLIGEGTLGPSVDLDSFEAEAVMAGTDEPITWEMIEAYYEEHGTEPPVELLITQGRVRAATLVSIPAFAETPRPLELIEQDADALALIAAEEEGADTGEVRAREMERVRALVASVEAQARPAAPELAAFALPALAGPTPITWDWKRGVVYGHIATWQTCHVGYTGVCITPPRAEGGYGWFNRYAVDTSDGGTIWAGRLTLGGPHPGLSLAASSAMAAYDGKTVAADVVAYEDEYGIVVAGAIRPGLDGGQMAILERRKVSGDWREIGGSLALIEVLALSPGLRRQSEPGFPVQTHARNGRQTALVACLSPDPGLLVSQGAIDISGAVREALAAERAAERARAALAATVEAHDQEQADAARQALAAALGED